MPSVQEERERLAMAIADGEAIDWQGVEDAGVLPPHEIRALREFEALRILPSEASGGLPPGTVVGDFRLVSLIGEGGMGQVWEAEQLSLSRRVALKFVRPDRVTEHQLALFAREARAGGRMNHPGIVTIYGYGRSEGLAWIAMELVRGAKDLRDYLDEITRAEEVPAGHDRRVARYAAEIADAMQAAHAAGVIHRDLKPQNVLITPEDRPKVTDFGVARIADEQALSRSGEPAGTYLYMSPEQLAGRRSDIDHRTDIFSLGVVLYELVALRRPFEGDTSHQVAQQILGKDPPDPRTFRSRVPRDLAVIAGKALEKERGKRFQTMEELAQDLRRFLAGEPIHARPPTTTRKLLKWVRRNPGRSSAAAIASVAMVLISLLLLANVRANRDLRQAVGALRSKTEEAERSAREAGVQATLATARADDVLRLSALQKLDDLGAEADRLWPAHPENVRKYEDWLEKAGQLAAELPDHQKKLAVLRAKARPWPEEDRAKTRPDWTFEDTQDRWWHNQLVKLVEGLEAFADEQTGLLSGGISPEHGWGVEKRLEFARTVEERSVRGPEASARWAEASASIRDPSECPMYAGLRLTPQLGLLPIGRDPGSGLWEFAHPQTGELPVRDPNGKLVLKEETGLVFVLLPGGTFAMGAQNSDPEGANFAPQANPDESPVHQVTLSPFFLSKYEVTQGQWERFTGSNPSYQKPPGALTPSLLHPVEQVSWTSCMEACDRLGLALPSEAQWEFGARAGTATVWWTGNERESVLGAANVADQAAVRAGASWLDAKDWPELDDGYAVHAPVDGLAPNPFGLHGLIGNVWEWCRDGYQIRSYDRQAQDDPVADPAGCSRCVARGGSFMNAVVFARSAYRGDVPPENADVNLGLRPARRVIIP